MLISRLRPAMVCFTEDITSENPPVVIPQEYRRTYLWDVNRKEGPNGPVNIVDCVNPGGVVGDSEELSSRLLISWMQVPGRPGGIAVACDNVGSTSVWFHFPAVRHIRRSR